MKFSYSMDEPGVFYYRVTASEDKVYKSGEEIMSPSSKDDEPNISGASAFGRSNGVYYELYGNYNGLVNLEGINCEETSYLWFVVLYETGRFSEIIQYTEDSFYNIEALDFSIGFKESESSNYVEAFEDLISSLYDYQESNL